MRLEEILKKAIETPPSKDEALYILRRVDDIDKFRELSKVANIVREEERGNVFKIDGFVAPITSCDTDPPCRYCSRARHDMSMRDPLNEYELELAFNILREETSVKRVELGGGTLWKGAGDKVIKAVSIAKRVAPEIKIWINVGPSLNRDDLLKLKEMGVIEVCSSLETINPQIFSEAKPGDSLEARIKLAREINEVGLGLTSVMMVGLGSNYEDYVNHIFWLKQFSNLSHFPITGFRPIPGTPFSNRKMASPLEVAKIGAVARLVLRRIDISFGGIMNDPRLIPLWIMAGANRAIHLGPHIHRPSPLWSSWARLSGEVRYKRIDNLEFIDLTSLTRRFITEAGMEPEF